jgi:hypothetical protein
MPRREFVEAIHVEIGDGSGEQGQRLRDKKAADDCGTEPLTEVGTGADRDIDR